MSKMNEILEMERPDGESGWIEYSILKLWEETNGYEWITDNAAAELSALRERVEALEKRAKWKLANWECPHCGYVNDGDWTSCLRCKENRA